MALSTAPNSVDLVTSRLARLRAMAASAVVEVEHVYSDSNAAHPVAIGDMRALRSRKFDVVKPVQCQELKAAIDAVVMLV